MPETPAAPGSGSYTTRDLEVIQLRSDLRDYKRRVESLEESNQSKDERIQALEMLTNSLSIRLNERFGWIAGIGTAFTILAAAIAAYIGRLP